jgi:hypothetical protein
MWDKEELPDQWGRRLLLHQFTKRKLKLTVVIIVVYHRYQFHTEFYLISLTRGHVHI